ncbi:hypothetical protein AAHC03_01791 [Spirometra sp. Aus1]
MAPEEDAKAWTFTRLPWATNYCASSVRPRLDSPSPPTSGLIAATRGTHDAPWLRRTQPQAALTLPLPLLDASLGSSLELSAREGRGE